MDVKEALEKIMIEARPLGQEAVVESMERFLAANDEHRTRYGSSRHVIGSQYFKNMSDRLHYQLEEAMKILEKYR